LLILFPAEKPQNLRMIINADLEDSAGCFYNFQFSIVNIQLIGENNEWNYF